MILSKKLIGWMTVVFALTSAWPAAATLFVRVADSHLAQDAEIIAEVIARDSSVVEIGGRPGTHLRVDVIEWLAGAALETGEPLTLRLPGGARADGMEVRFSGIPRLEAGERALVFLKTTETPGVYRLLHLMQGFFRIAEAAGEKVAYRHFEGATEVSLPGRKTLDPEMPRDFGRFAAWIRDLRAGEPRSADYWTPSPVASQEIQSQAEKFTLFENSGFNMRYREFDSGARVTWFSHSGGQPGLPSGGHPEVQAALNAWNADPATPINLRYGGQSGATAGFGNFDGQNVVLFDDLSGDIGEVFSCSTGGTLAIGGPWFNSSNRHMFQGREFITILGGDIVTAEGLACWIPFNNRGPEVIAHELGHTLGLGHSCGDGPSGPCNTNAKNDALMRATAHGDGRGARLGADDRAAIAFLHGAQLTPPAAPSNLQASSVRVGVVDLTWNDNSNNETSFSIERSRNGGSFQQIASRGAGSRSYRDETAPSGSTVSYRVQASNSAGTSGFSNQATLTTAGAPPPSGLTVEILSATEARLTWTDNAVDETGFEVQADGFGVFLPVGTAAADATELVITGLWPATSYTFRLRSVGGDSGASSFVQANGITLLGPPPACVEDTNTLCLNQGRFRVQVGWRDFEDRIGPGRRVEIPATDSGVFWFFGADNWEMLVKVLDACSFNEHFWVFAAATTNVEFTLITGDTQTGAVTVHENGLGVSAPAITDTEALPVCTDAGPIVPVVTTRSTEDPSIQAPEVAPRLEQVLKESCMETGTSTCLLSERFQVRGTWRDFQNNTGEARIVDLPVVSDESGLLWFFSPDNWEVLVKILNGCPVNDRYWVFSAATTNVEYNLEVTDTMTGQVKTYTNTLGESAAAVTDTDAFATCP